jgi:hypothetical protein
MAMFPLALPNLNKELYPKSTSDFFKSQERACFAQAGRLAPRASVPLNPSPMFPPLSPLSSHRHTPTSDQLPPNHHPPSPVLHQTMSGLQTPLEDTTTPSSSKAEYEPDESWRRPMPYEMRKRWKMEKNEIFE